MPTVNASTRRLGRLTLTLSSPAVSATTRSMPLKSAVDSDVERDLVVPGALDAALDHVPDLIGGTFTHGTRDHPRLAERQPRVQPRNTSTLRRSCTTSVSGTSCCLG